MDEVNIPELILKKFSESIEADPVLGKNISDSLISSIQEDKCTKDSAEKILKK